MNDWTDHKNYNCRIYLDDGREVLVFGNWLHNQGHDNWQDWTCMAGTKRLYIGKNFDVYGGECRHDHLGNALTGFNLLENGTRCTRITCTGCVDDIIVEKYR